MKRFCARNWPVLAIGLVALITAEALLAIVLQVSADRSAGRAMLPGLRQYMRVTFGAAGHAKTLAAWYCHIQDYAATRRREGSFAVRVQTDLPDSEDSLPSAAAIAFAVQHCRAVEISVVRVYGRSADREVLIYVQGR